MPQLSEIVTETLDGVIRAVHTSERQHLLAHIDAVNRLDGGPVDGLTRLRTLLEDGYLPDYFIGAEIEISAQLSMSTARERTVSGGGAVALGPVRVEGSLANTFRQGTQTNVAVSINLVRQSRNQGLDYLLTAIRTAPGPALPTGGS